MDRIIFDNGLLDPEAIYDEIGQLGCVKTSKGWQFRVWSPFLSAASLNLYKYSAESSDLDILGMPMQLLPSGVWEIEVCDFHGGSVYSCYYTYTIINEFGEFEVVDPYAYSVGAHGTSDSPQRGLVVDFSLTNPDGWQGHTAPIAPSNTDRIIYEVHIRDFSISSDSGVSPQNRGKYLAFTERNTKNPQGLATCLEHLIELGVTDVHILPMFDFASIDETSNAAQYNWGYDPLNYNAPEGSFSSDPSDGYARVKELKQMILSLHKAGLRVIMDVVYNHTYSTDNNLNRLAPKYYYRTNREGEFTNGSGCGNETASERIMFKKFMLDSTAHWVREYKIDGFRFDLMGVHDINTINHIRENLVKINPNILIYGEGWTGGYSALKSEFAALKHNAVKLPHIAFFNDDLRDAIKGSVFKARDKGFISGKTSLKAAVCRGITAQVALEQDKTEYARWSPAPTSTINYVSCHDNLTFHDKIALASGYTADTPQGIRQNMLGATIVLTAQGIPFIHAGEEFVRTKPADDTSREISGEYDHNSYRSSDKVNAIQWSNKTKYYQLFKYYQALIALRKSNKAFRLTTAQQIQECISFPPVAPDIIAYQITTSEQTIMVYLNPQDKTEIKQEEKWQLLLETESYAKKKSNKKVKDGYINLPAISATILKKL